MENTMTRREGIIGFRAMYHFLVAYDNRGPTDEIQMLLGSLVIGNAGGPLDAALWGDWKQALAIAESEVDFLPPIPDWMDK